MKETVRARIRVYGVVQGVGYRYFVYKTATSLNLSGYVKNLPDGSVEVVAQGERGLVNALIDDLKLGPRYAHVERIDIIWQEPEQDCVEFSYGF